eukprot:TRINITY_DN26591_c0_g1_i1.p1 TRINITY_DN26591_c0_g1~~TRINITY_DN26591_c0_g1_i1.p1  ORF type:complete len:379 (+),score=36.36 TRINITY_DN26591_c0_g1_i1:62-1198(+)
MDPLELTVIIFCVLFTLVWLSCWCAPCFDIQSLGKLRKSGYATRKSEYVFTVGLAVVDAIQLSALVFVQGVSWSDKYGVYDFFRATLLRMSDDSWPTIFTICSIILIVGFLLTFLLLFNDFGGRSEAAARARQLRMRVFSEVFYVFLVVTIFINVLPALDCHYPEGKEAFVYVDPEVKCWKDNHFIYVLLAFLLLPYYFIAMRLTTEVVNAHGDIQYDRAYTVIYTQAKFVLCIAAVFLSHNRDDAALLTTAILVFSFLVLLLDILWKPYRLPHVSGLRRGCLFLPVASSLIAKYAIEVDDETNSTPELLVVICLPLLFIMALVLSIIDKGAPFEEDSLEIPRTSQDTEEFESHDYVDISGSVPEIGTDSTGSVVNNV